MANASSIAGLLLTTEAVFHRELSVRDLQRLTGSFIR
jgi:hypothetical protein